MESSSHILVESPELIPSAQVGVLHPLRFLEERNARCSVRFKRTVDITAHDIAWSDIVVSVRGSSPLSHKIMNTAKEHGRFFVYFLDDDLLNIPQEIPSGAYFSDAVVRQSLLSCLKSSDVFWCVNRHLGEKYKKYTDGRLVISRVPVAFDDPIETQKEAFPLKILYAGSFDHGRSIQRYVTPAVVRLCQEFGNKIEFTFIGANPGIHGYNNVKHVPYHEIYSEYKQAVSNHGFRIGLAVIEDCDFYRCKYYNKFLEYTSIGAIGVYSDLEPYTLIVKDGENGFLCSNTPEAWYGSMKRAIEHVRGNDSFVLKNAIQILREHHDYESVSRSIQQDIPELEKFHAKRINVQHVVLKNSAFEYYSEIIARLWRKHGIFFVPVLAVKVLRKIAAFFRRSFFKGE